LARTYEVTASIRLVNRIMGLLIRLGTGPRGLHILSVRGRRTGRVHSTPVRVLELDGRRWLVSPYGEVGWVRNARAVGEVTLRRGRRSGTVKVTEVSPREATPVLRTYIKEESFARPYFDVAFDASDEAIEAQAPRHPVFRIED
jgi:deazaflavin-dependent oxidoreductase (nitroreductase family)